MNLKPIKANMNEVETGEYKILFRYRTPVAVILNDGTSFKTDKKWSQTTTKHINAWFGMQGTDVTEPTDKPQKYFDNLLNEVK